MRWKAYRSRGVLFILLALAGVISVDLVLLYFLRALPITLLTFFLGVLIVASLPVLGLFVYWLYGYFNLSYELERNGLIITWAAMQQVVPMGSIREIVRGAEIPGPVRVDGLNWPGYQVGSASLPQLGETLIYATRPLSEQLIVVTSALSYGISPADPDSFLADFELRRPLGAVQPWEQTTRRAGWVTLPIWTDRYVRVLSALAFGLNALLFAYICARYPTIPPLVPFHFDALGYPDRIGLRSEMFRLPLFGLLVLLLNAGLGLLAYPRERLATYLLLGAAAFMQVLLAGAIFSLIR